MLIVLMARVPIPGNTKTRLQSHLSGTECALLHKAFISDMVSMVKKAELCAALAYTPSSGERAMRSFIQHDIPLFAQEGCDLGAKMLKCLEWGFGQGHTKVGLIGTDMPELQPELLKKADKLLDIYDVVIGPSEDGGYYFIGMKKVIPQIFKDLSWGKETVRNETVEILRELNLTWTMLSPQRDVDVWDDLVYLDESLALETKAHNDKFFPETTYLVLQSLDIKTRTGITFTK